MDKFSINIQKIFDLSKDSGSIENALLICQDALIEINKMQDKNHSEEECFYLSLLMGFGFNEGKQLSAKLLSQHIGCNGIEIIPALRLLNQLYLNGIVERVKKEPFLSKAAYGDIYFLNTNQLDAFMEGRLGSLNANLSMATIDSFLNKINSYFNSFIQNDYSVEEFHKLLLQLYEYNHQLPVCIKILNYIKTRIGGNPILENCHNNSRICNEHQKELIILMLLIARGYDIINNLKIKTFLEQVFPSEHNESDVIKLFTSYLHPLFKDRHLVRKDSNILGDDDEFEFTKKFYSTFISKNKQNQNGILNLEIEESLLPYSKIALKKLWFNEALQQQLNEIKGLLSNVNLKKSLKLLKSEFGRKPGITMLFHGDPGTGKTEFVYQLARETKRAIFKVDMSSLRSMWYGKSEQLVKEAFEEYKNLCKKKNCLPIMFMNEADAIVGKRLQVERTVDQTHNSIQNILLEELENFEGILICTTNLIHNLDKAFERRFFFKVAFEMPNSNVQAQIWEHYLPKLSKAEIQELTTSHHLSPANIANIAQKLTIKRVLGGMINLGCIHDFAEEESLIKSKEIGFGPQPKKSIGF